MVFMPKPEFRHEIPHSPYVSPEFISSLGKHKPSTLTKAERIYYKESFGFDPVTDRIKDPRQGLHYRLWFFARGCSALDEVGVELGADVWFSGNWLNFNLLVRVDPLERWIFLNSTVVEGWRKIYPDFDDYNELNPPWEEFQAYFGKIPVVEPAWGTFARLSTAIRRVANEGLSVLNPDLVSSGFHAVLGLEIARALWHLVPKLVDLNAAGFFIQGKPIYRFYKTESPTPSQIWYREGIASLLSILDELPGLGEYGIDTLKARIEYFNPIVGNSQDYFNSGMNKEEMRYWAKLGSIMVNLVKIELQEIISSEYYKDYFDGMLLNAILAENDGDQNVVDESLSEWRKFIGEFLSDFPRCADANLLLARISLASWLGEYDYISAKKAVHLDCTLEDAWVALALVESWNNPSRAVYAKEICAEGLAIIPRAPRLRKYYDAFRFAGKGRSTSLTVYR